MTANFGDAPGGWAFAPQELPPGCPPPRPVSEVPGPRPGAAAAAVPAQQQEPQQGQQQEAAPAADGAAQEAAVAADGAAEPQPMEVS